MTGLPTNRRIRLPLEPPPEALVAVIDTREQMPLDLAPLQTMRGGLATGDYSIRNLERVIAVERKSLPDLLSCVAGERQRFDREIQRLLAYPTRAVVVEATWAQLEAGGWRGKVTPAAATASVLGWMAAGVPFLFAGDHDSAGKAVAKLLFLAARRRWREARGLASGILEQEGAGS
jgi:ERCC4-type nuclease